MNGYFDRVAKHIDKLDGEARRKHWQVLTDEIAFFESVFAALREGVIVLDSGGIILYANAAAGKLASFSLEKEKGKSLNTVLTGWNIDDLLYPPEELSGWSRNISREIEVTYPEHRILDLNAMPGVNNGTVILLRDVTVERARARAALADSQTNAVCELAAGVAHEIGNPLNALSLNLQLLGREFKNEPDEERRARLQSDIASAQNEVKRLEGIIREFLTALRPAKPQTTPKSLADPLKETLATLKAQLEDRQIKVSIDLPPALPPVMIDSAQIKQVFFNLIKNAMEAMKDGGSLEIELSSDDQYVTVSFLDNGSGMSDETIAHVFEPYHTTKKHGTGLGLMVSQRIIRAHGGEIDITSKEGFGTKFFVRLPRLEKRIRRLS